MFDTLKEYREYCIEKLLYNSEITGIGVYYKGILIENTRDLSIWLSEAKDIKKVYKTIFNEQYFEYLQSKNKFKSEPVFKVYTTDLYDKILYVKDSIDTIDNNIRDNETKEKLINDLIEKFNKILKENFNENEILILSNCCIIF